MNNENNLLEFFMGKENADHMALQDGYGFSVNFGKQTIIL